MATGLYRNGIDFDSLFMARVNAKRADVGIKVAGVDISNRYEPIGSGSPITATNFKTVGTDVASLFRNIGEPLGSSYAMTAGNYDTGFGSYGTGYHSGFAAGSLSPTTYKGATIERMDDLWAFGTTPYFIISLLGNYPQNYFTQIQINGHTYLSASAAGYANNPDYNSEWYWTEQAGLIHGGGYSPFIS